MIPRLTKYGPCAFLFLCLLAAPTLFSWVVSLLSSQPVMLDLRGLEIPAVYKRAERHADGSIDLTINIPASVNVLNRLMGWQEQIKKNLTKQSKLKAQKKAKNAKPPDVPKTYYPVTLDSPYILNSPRVCEQVEPLHVLVIVHTATANFQRRRLIRETWAGKNLMKTLNQRVLFLLGLTKDISIQRMIENELLVYGDLVQGQFKDTYHNLTHKGVLAYRWINQYCPQAQMILKVDDDMFVNPFLFYDVYFPWLRLRNRTIACHVRPINTSPIQRQRGKWRVHDFEFRGYKHYPVQYCNGYMVIITPDIIRAMYSAAYTTPFFWVDDVYLYGMLPAKVGNISHMDLAKNLTLIPKFGLGCYNKPNCSILATLAPVEASLNELWKLTLGQIPKSLKSEVNPVYLMT